MKQPKKPTREQKEYIKAAGLDWRNWMVPVGIAGEDNISLTLINKKSGRRRVIFK